VSPGPRGSGFYFYSFDLTPIERQRAATGLAPELLRNWEAILQITVDPSGAVSAMDLALPGRPCAIVQTGEDARRAVQHFEFDGRRLRLTSKAFSICDLKVEDVPSQRFEWDVTIRYTGRRESLEPEVAYFPITRCTFSMKRSQ
jgi:hypothetical protein